jgi:hypothetical protein
MRVLRQYNFVEDREVAGEGLAQTQQQDNIAPQRPVDTSRVVEGNLQEPVASQPNILQDRQSNLLIESEPCSSIQRASTCNASGHCAWRRDLGECVDGGGGFNVSNFKDTYNRSLEFPRVHTQDKTVSTLFYPDNIYIPRMNKTTPG